MREYEIDRRRCYCDHANGEVNCYNVHTHYVHLRYTSSFHQNTPSRVFHSLPVSSTFQFHSSQRIYHFHSNHCKSPLPFSFSPLTHEHLPHNERAERPRSLFARQPVECLHGFQRPPSEDDENREFQGTSPLKPHSSPRQRSPPPSPNSNARDSRERYSLPLFLTHVGRL